MVKTKERPKFDRLSGNSSFEPYNGGNSTIPASQVSRTIANSKSLKNSINFLQCLKRTKILTFGRNLLNIIA